jgi:hypothetical protein
MKKAKAPQGQIPISRVLKMISWTVLAFGITFAVLILFIWPQSSARFLYCVIGIILSISLAAVLRLLAVIGQVIFEIGQRSYTRMINSQAQAEETHAKLDKSLETMQYQNKQIAALTENLNDCLGNIIGSLEQVKNIIGADVIKRVDKIQTKQSQVECDIKEIVQDIRKLSHIFEQIASRLNIKE